MTLHISDTETEKLAAEIAEMTGDTKTGAVRQALREKKKRLELRAGTKAERRQKRVWTGGILMIFSCTSSKRTASRCCPSRKAIKKSPLRRSTVWQGPTSAALNLGDCMTYASAQVAGQSLLFIGDDFARTDIAPA